MQEVDLPKNETASAVGTPQRHNLPVREWFFKLRALIALVLLIAIFASLSPAFFDDRQPANSGQTCRHQCDSGHRHDLRDFDWRH